MFTGGNYAYNGPLHIILVITEITAGLYLISGLFDDAPWNRYQAPSARFAPLRNAPGRENFNLNESYQSQACLGIHCYLTHGETTVLVGRNKGPISGACIARQKGNVDFGKRNNCLCLHAGLSGCDPNGSSGKRRGHFTRRWARGPGTKNRTRGYECTARQKSTLLVTGDKTQSR